MKILNRTRVLLFLMIVITAGVAADKQGGLLNVFNPSKLPSPQRVTGEHGQIRVIVGRMDWDDGRSFGGPGNTRDDHFALGKSQRWLYVNIISDDFDLNKTYANPDNTILVTAYEPAVLFTNGIYYITFKP